MCLPPVRCLSVNPRAIHKREHRLRAHACRRSQARRAAKYFSEDTVSSCQYLGKEGVFVFRTLGRRWMGTRGEKYPKSSTTKFPNKMRPLAPCPLPPHCRQEATGHPTDPTATICCWPTPWPLCLTLVANMTETFIKSVKRLSREVCPICAAAENEGEKQRQRPMQGKQTIRLSGRETTRRMRDGQARLAGKDPKDPSPWFCGS